MPKILIIDDDEHFLRSAKSLLEYRKFSIHACSNPYKAEDIFTNHDFSCVLSDVVMTGIDGISLLKRFTELKPNVPVIMISGRSKISAAVDALKAGAFDFLEKPVDPDRLLAVLRNALERKNLYEDKEELIQQLTKNYTLIGNSSALQRIRRQIETLANTDAKILITGESGVGKEPVAAALHYHSSRSSKPFIKINCAAIPQELLESELFGHRKGAFTGALRNYEGKFLLADGGTLFLDEIGDLNINLQAKLLRVLQDGEIEPVGTSEVIKVDVRIISASNKDLEQMANKGNFRNDLLYRINTIVIEIPPLRERIEDIQAIAEHYLHKFAENYNKRLVAFSPSAIMQLQQYKFPGNVRELIHIVEKIAIFTKNHVIQPDDVLHALNRSHKQDNLYYEMTLEEARNTFEKNFIIEKLKENDWNTSKTAKILSLDRSHLFKKMKKLDIIKPENES